MTQKYTTLTKMADMNLTSGKSLPTLISSNAELPILVSNAGERATYRYVGYIPTKVPKDPQEFMDSPEM